MEPKSTTVQSRSKRLAELFAAAMDSYRKYLKCTDVMEMPATKLSLLVWPDIAQSAVWTIIADMENRGTSGELALLESDLHTAIICPIRGMLSATLTYAETKLSHPLPGIDARATEAFACADILEQKKLLIECINDAFKVLSLSTGKDYPQL